ncbi:MAG TPA: hypothetical protein VGX96_01405 [Candidatus Elarobacter sp.]|jgi:hypothetical protein|nr:hypothetical protein [Candidatus Elarobacter sp.]
MTGGGDLDEVQHEELEETLEESADEVGPVDVEDVDELGSTAEGEADAPVEYDVAPNENDPDPTAGASDIGGLAGGIDEDDGAPGDSSRR